MVGGDFSFDDVFSLSDNSRVSYLVWIMFIIVMPVLLSSMLVSYSYVIEHKKMTFLI